MRNLLKARLKKTSERFKVIGQDETNSVSPGDESVSNDMVEASHLGEDDSTQTTLQQSLDSSNTLQHQIEKRDQKINIEIKHAEQIVIPVDEELGLLENSNSDILENIFIKKSPLALAGKIYDDFNSIANTLDDIVTMGTNEVADDDIFSEYRQLDTGPEDIEFFIPTFAYVEPLLEVDEPLSEQASMSKHEAIEFSDINHLQIDEVKTKVHSQPKKLPPKLNFANIHDVSEQVILNDDADETGMNPDINIIDKLVEAQCNTNEQTSSKLNLVIESTDDKPSEHLDIPSENQSPLIYERSSTPLSFSSSDAAFYSPTDESLSESDTNVQDEVRRSNSQVCIFVNQLDFN